MSDKVVLITGGAARIGAEIGRTLHAQNYRIAIHYRRSAKKAEALECGANGFLMKPIRNDDLISKIATVIV